MHVLQMYLCDSFGSARLRFLGPWNGMLELALCPSHAAAVGMTSLVLGPGSSES